jgi:hypothetical protein
MDTKAVPKLPQYCGQIEQTGARGVWIPMNSADPYAGGNNHKNQRRREESAYYTYTYTNAVQKLREETFKPCDEVPLEFFQWERVLIDEVHESVRFATSTDELNFINQILTHRSLLLVVHNEG